MNDTPFSLLRLFLFGIETMYFYLAISLFFHCGCAYLHLVVERENSGLLREEERRNRTSHDGKSPLARHMSVSWELYYRILFRPIDLSVFLAEAGVISRQAVSSVSLQSGKHS